MPEAKRQLAAIMFTDIVGYTSLMGEDEEKAFELLKKNRQVQRPIIEKFNGRWLKEMGDGVLASFPSVSEAVYCASAIQKVCENEPDLKLRIGIHLGEVVFEDDDVFGDGVNIASRLEQLAPAGGILISESVHKNILNKRGIESQFIREEKLKNVKDPVPVYTVKVDDIEIQEAPRSFTESIETTEPGKIKSSNLKRIIFISLAIIATFSLAYFFYPDRFRSVIFTPSAASGYDEISIAIIPFINLSDNSKQEHIAAMTAELIRDKLSKLKDIRVISMTSTRQYRNTEKLANEIGEELNVSHLLEGSIFEFENDLRIVVQLIETNSDDHVWSETYDRSTQDILKVQNEIAYSVASKLKDNLDIGKKDLYGLSDQLDPSTLDSYLKGKQILEEIYNSEDSLIFAETIKIFSSVISKYPQFADAYTSLAYAYQAQNYIYGNNVDLNVSAVFVKVPSPDTISSLMNKALEIDPNNTGAIEFFAFYYLYGDGNDQEKGIEHLNRILQINPNQHYVKSILGTYYLRKKDFQQAIAFLIDGIKEEIP